MNISASANTNKFHTFPPLHKLASHPIQIYFQPEYNRGIISIETINNMVYFVMKNKDVKVIDLNNFNRQFLIKKPIRENPNNLKLIPITFKDKFILVYNYIRGSFLTTSIISIYDNKGQSLCKYSDSGYIDQVIDLGNGQFAYTLFEYEKGKIKIFSIKDKNAFPVILDRHVPKILFSNTNNEISAFFDEGIVKNWTLKDKIWKLDNLKLTKYKFNTDHSRFYKISSNLVVCYEYYHQHRLILYDISNKKFSTQEIELDEHITFIFPTTDESKFFIITTNDSYIYNFKSQTLIKCHTLIKSDILNVLSLDSDEFVAIFKNNIIQIWRINPLSGTLEIKNSLEIDFTGKKPFLLTTGYNYCKIGFYGENGSVVSYFIKKNALKSNIDKIPQQFYDISVNYA